VFDVATMGITNYLHVLSDILKINKIKTEVKAFLKFCFKFQLSCRACDKMQAARLCQYDDKIAENDEKFNASGPY